MSLIHALRTALRDHAHATAVVEGDDSHSYAELDRLSADMAGGLAEHGVTGGDIVAIQAARGWDRCVAVLAAWRLGAGVVSIDREQPAARARKIAVNSGTRLVLRGRGTPPLADFGAPTHTFDEMRGKPGDDADDGPVCYVIPTSGSTGEPKAVAVPPATLANLGRWHVDHWPHPTPPDTLHAASVGFDVGYEELVATWLSGARLVIVDDPTRRDFPALHATLRRHRVARAFLPVQALHGLAMAALLESEGLPDLRELVIAGERLVVNDEVREFCAADGLALVNHYGPSETHVVTHHRLPGHPSAWPDHPPIGNAVAGVELLAHADGAVRPFAPGEEAELVIAGDCVALGYLGDDELTARRFRRLPHRDGALRRCYFSGDQVRFDGRDFHFLHRVDQQLKIRGYRVEPGEVEAVVQAVPGVRHAVAFGVGHGNAHLGVCYALRDDGSVTATELRAACRDALPDYMVPAHYWELEEFPVTRNGKVDRAALRQMFTHQ
ncbi:amino acid adenylation domain-containing protein [Streptomyces sp. NBRC 109706]|uniref:amino acid adenylation domain-containing protein n=1 Tax=Streptomyces sp. NBRC 109706 TaxID=1550035 RepID=UPI0007820275|nr:amino acid adenylation domain-containing protein [Streptomyces sp. NBRC 109706]